MNLNGIVHWYPVQIYYSLPFCGYFEKTTEYSLILPENEKKSYHYVQVIFDEIDSVFLQLNQNLTTNCH